MSKEAQKLMNEMLEEIRSAPTKLSRTSLIKISKEYKYFAGSIWLGREVTIDEGIDDPIAAYKKAEAEMDTYYRSRNQITQTDYNTGQTSVVQVDKGKNHSTVDSLINDIEKCTTLDGIDGLSSFRWVIGSDPRLTDAYEKRKQELLNK